MSKFKVGDRVKITRRKAGNFTGALDWKEPNGDVGRVCTIVQTLPGGEYELKAFTPVNGEDYVGYFSNEDIELVNKGENTVKERRTFKLLKDTPTVKKGALYQEACDDGTQEYVLISHEDLKDESHDPMITDRSLVEDQPQFFVEVFKVTPEYMTREELDKWEAFKGQKKRGRPAGVKNVAVTKTKQKRAPWSAKRRAAFEAKKQR